MILSVHQPQYLPWLGYFDKIRKSDAFVFLDQVQYKEREFQNRNKIRTKEGWLWLTVPVKSIGQGRQQISAVQVDNELDWRKKHWSSLKACYGKSRFFKQYEHFFAELYAREWEKLVDLNIYIIDFLLQEFKIKTPVYYESKIGTSMSSTDRIIELCQKLKSDIYLSGQGGKEYLAEEKFSAAGITLAYQQFAHPRYHQMYAGTAEEFVPNLTALDLLFNEGDHSLDILKGES
jgi:hypothetical protein